MNSLLLNAGKRLVISSCFCIFLVTANKLMGTVYYVATDGSDNNSGISLGAPWATIQKAADNVSGGDTVYIEAGNYGAENVVFTTSGTENLPITFEGYKITPGDNPTINYIFGDSLDSSKMPLLDGGDRSSAGIAINFNGKNRIILKNIQIQNYNIAVRGYSIEYCTLENIIAVDLGDPIASYDGKGISVGGSGNNNILKRCIVANACAEGISVLGDFNTIENSQVYCDDDTSIEAAMDYYIIVNGNYNTIAGCYVERIGNLPHGGHGIQLKGDCEYNLIKDCISKKQACGCFGARHRGVRYNMFENCTALGKNGEGRAVPGFLIRDGACYNTYINCITQGVDYAVDFLDTTEDENAQNAGHDNYFNNCIFNDTKLYSVLFSNYDVESPAYDNCFVNCTFRGGDYLFGCNRQNYDNVLVNCIVTSVSNLYTGTYALDYESTYSDFYNNGFSTPAGTGNFSGDPLFTDIANGDLSLKPGSSCIDTGSTVSLDSDYNYLSRPYNFSYDVGANEYNAADALVYFMLNENTGTSTADTMENISNGTISGAGWVSGISGNALSFDGIDDSVNFGKPSILELDGSRSISAWVKPSQNDTYNTIAAKYVWGFGLFTSYGKLRASVRGSQVTARSKSNEVLSTDEWQHVAMTFDGNGDKKIHLYLNGEEVTYAEQTAMVGFPVSNSAYNFTIGSDNSIRYWFNGIIDNVKVFARSLNSQEIFDDYVTVFSVKFDEGGGVVYDTSNRNNGTINEASRVEGVYGRALNFNGINESVSFGDILDIGTGDRSISLWVKTTCSASNYHVLISKGYSSTSNQHAISLINGKIRCLMDISGADRIVDTGTMIDDGNWHHIAVTIDRSDKIKLYLDGTLNDEDDISSDINIDAQNSYGFYLGRSHYGQYFPGSIDEVKIYNKALSSSEVNNIYQEY